MLIYAGIDEAGYGPLLGPLVVGCAMFAFPDHDPETGAPKMWTLLRHSVAKQLKTAKGRIVVNDSKKLKGAKSSKYPLRHLERGVLTFLATQASSNDSSVESSDLSYLDRVAPTLQKKRDFQALPWYAGEPTLLSGAHSAEELAIAINVLHRNMQKSGITLQSLDARMLLVPQFNSLVSRLNSKAAASFQIIGQHLAHILKTQGHHHPRIIVDRQGARAHYRQQLQTLFPEAAIQIVDETNRFSRYTLTVEHLAMTVTFVEKADATYFPAALASMVAKYTRELCMNRLNRFFLSHLPDLKPTAGYVKDGRRYVHDIQPIIKRLNINSTQLIRSR